MNSRNAFFHPRTLAVVAGLIFLQQAISQTTLPVLSASPVRTVEGNNGVSTVSLPLYLSSPASTPVSIQWTTADGTATAGTDFTAGSGTVIFNPGEIYRTIQVEIMGDAMDELDESFRIEFSAPDGLTAGDSSVRILIQNDEPVTAVQIGSSIGFFEIQPAAPVPFVVSNPTPGRTAQVAVTGGTATSNVDYALTQTQVDLSTRLPDFPLNVFDDTIPESDETLQLTLSNGSPGVRFAPSALRQTLAADGMPSGIAVEGDLLAATNGSQLKILRRNAGLWVTEATFDGTAEGGVSAVGMDQGIIAADFMQTGVKIFSRSAGVWTLMATVPHPTAEADPRRTLSIQDDTLVIGDPRPAGETSLSGEVRIHERHHGGRGVWGLRQTLQPMSIQPDYGSAVSLWGPYIATNSPGSYTVPLFRRIAAEPRWQQVAEYVRYTANFGNSIAVNGQALVMSQSGGVLSTRPLDATGMTWLPPVVQSVGFSQTNAQLSLRDGMLCGKASETSVRILTLSAAGQWVEPMSLPLSTNPSVTPRQMAFDGRTLAVTGNGDATSAPISIYGSEGWVGTILDNEEILFTVPDTNLVSGAYNPVTVLLSRPLSFAVNVRVSTVEGTALASSDFINYSTTLSFSPGSTSATVNLYAAPPEAGESLETFGLHLDEPNIGTTGPDGIITILPPAAELSVATSYTEILEGNSGTRSVTIHSTLSQPSAAGDSYTWKLIDSTTTVNQDYPAASGEVTLPAGSTTSSFTFQISGDFTGEADEELTVQLEKKTGLRVSVFNNRTTVRILNDDVGLAVADTFSMPQGGVLTGQNVRNNDTRIQQVVLEGAPTNGTVSLLPDGAFTYTPTVNFTGTASFGYRDFFTVTNGTVRIVQASINVLDGNIPPVIKEDLFTIKEDAALDTTAETALHLFSNDGLFSAAGVAYNPILEVSVQNITNGTLTTSPTPTGRFVFTPAPDFVGNAGFTYRVRDKDGWSNPAAVTIRVQDDLPLPPLQRLNPNGSQLHRSILSSAGFTATQVTDTLFTFKAGQTVSFRALPGGSVVFGKLEIQDASGNLLAGGITGPNSFDNVPIPADGTYRILVGQRGTAGTSSFHLLVNGGLPGTTTTAAAPYPLDTARPAGSVRAAVAATMSSSQANFYSFSGLEGEKIHLYLHSNQVQPFILQTSQNVRLANSVASPLDTRASTLTYVLPSTATYKVFVQGASSADYTLQLYRTPGTHELASPTLSTATLTGRGAGYLSGLGVPSTAAPEPSLTFAAFADYGSGSANQAAVATMVKTWNPDFIIAAGDHNYALDYTIGTPSWTTNVGNFYGSFIKGRMDNRYPEQTSIQQRFFPVPGNHDTGPDSGNGGELSSYFEYFHSNPGAPARLPAGVHEPRLSYYKMSQGNVDFFLLDSDNAMVSSVALNIQRQWLKDQIRTSTARWKIGVWHHPPFSSSASHGSQFLMQWGADFAGLHAIITGHDHTYERLNIGFDIAQFVVGIGGNSFYNFASSPAPGSVVRYNSNHGALRVISGTNGMQFDFLSIGTPGGNPIDSYTIGTPPPVVALSGIDSWNLTVSRGSTIQLNTSTPSAPGSLQNLTDPLLELMDPSGTVVATDFNSSYDGKNARLVYTVPVAGGTAGEVLNYTVRVVNESTGAGEYELRLTTPPDNSYQTWATAQLTGQPGGVADDPDLDGRPNLLEFLLDSSPTQAAVPAGPTLVIPPDSPLTLQINLPSTWTRPVHAILQSSGQLTTETWTTLATKSPGANHWDTTGPAGIQSNPGGGYTLPLPSGTRLFYRLAFALD